MHITSATHATHPLPAGMDDPWIVENFSWYYKEQPPGHEHLAWTVCYRDEEDDGNGCGYATGETFWLALADLLIRYPREA